MWTYFKRHIPKLPALKGSASESGLGTSSGVDTGGQEQAYSSNRPNAKPMPPVDSALQQNIVRKLPELKKTSQGVFSLGTEIEGEFIGITRFVSSINTLMSTTRKSLGHLQESLLGDAARLPFEFSTQLFKKSLDLVEANVGFAERILESLSHYSEEMEKVLAYREEMEKVFSYIRALIVNLRTKAVQLGPEDRSAFLAIAEELELNYSRIRTLVDTCFSKLDEVSSLIKHAEEQYVQGLSEQKSRIETSRKIIDERLQALNSSTQPIHAFSDSIESALAETMPKVQTIVMALQYQDIVRQKLERVSHSIDEAANTYEKQIDQSDTPEANQISRLALFYQILTLEKKQIMTAQDDIGRAGTDIMSGIETFIETTEQLKSSLHSLETTARNTMSDTRTADAFVEQVQQLNSIIRTNAEINESIPPIIEKIEEVATAFNSDISCLTDDMRIIALNSQVRAATAGSGKDVMTKLSEETRQMTDNTLSVSIEMCNTLQSISTNITNLRMNIEEFMNVSHSDLEELNSESNRSSSLLHELQANMLDKMGHSGSDFDGIEKEARSTLANIKFPEIVENRLNDAYALIDSLTDTLNPFSDWDLVSREDREKFDVIREKFTMAAQHTLLDETLQNSTDQTTPVDDTDNPADKSTEATAQDAGSMDLFGDDDDDVLFNDHVESAESGTPEPPSPSPQSKDDSVELFGDDDSIELFGDESSEDKAKNDKEDNAENPSAENHQSGEPEPSKEKRKKDESHEKIADNIELF